MTNFENSLIATELELARARAERVGWHLREIDLRREAERAAERRSIGRSAGWLVRVAQMAASWLF